MRASWASVSESDDSSRQTIAINDMFSACAPLLEQRHLKTTEQLFLATGDCRQVS